MGEKASAIFMTSSTELIHKEECDFDYATYDDYAVGRVIVQIKAQCSFNKTYRPSDTLTGAKADISVFVEGHRKNLPAAGVHQIVPIVGWDMYLGGLILQRSQTPSIKQLADNLFKRYTRWSHAYHAEHYPDKVEREHYIKMEKLEIAAAFALPELETVGV